PDRRALRRQLQDTRRARRARLLPHASRRAPLPDLRADRLGPDKRTRIISIVAPLLTFVQMILPGTGRWGGALHPVNAILILFLYGWLFYTLRKEGPEVATAPTTDPNIWRSAGRARLRVSGT